MSPTDEFANSRADDPLFKLCGVEADQSPDFDVGDAALSDQTSDEADIDPEPAGNFGYIE